MCTESQFKSFSRALLLIGLASACFLFAQSGYIWADTSCYRLDDCINLVTPCPYCTRHTGPSGCLFEQSQGDANTSYPKEVSEPPAHPIVYPLGEAQICYWVKPCVKDPDNNSLCEDWDEPYKCKSQPEELGEPVITRESWFLAGAC